MCLNKITKPLCEAGMVLTMTVDTLMMTNCYIMYSACINCAHYMKQEKLSHYHIHCCMSGYYTSL